MSMAGKIVAGLAAQAAVLLLAGAAPAAAQTGNQSDVTGPPITSGEVAGGTFAPGSVAGVTGFRSVPVANAYSRAAQALELRLDSLRFTLERGERVAPLVQRQILALLSGNGPDREAAEGLAAALAGGEGGAAPARRLVAALHGLTARAQRDAGRPKSAAARQIREAVAAYNDLIDTSGRELLQDPPAELLAVRAVLHHLVEGAWAGERPPAARVTGVPAPLSSAPRTPR